MKRFFPVALLVAGCLMAAPRWFAQAPAAGDAAATGQTKPAGESQPPSASQSSANPFPEDTSTVPVMPSTITPELPEGSYNGAENAPLSLPGEDLDPVRSPDDPAPTVANGPGAESSSSLENLDKLLPKPEDDQPGRKRKLLVKAPTHQEASSKDIEIGNYYLQTKNWKAALSRFESAMVLDPENPEVYWGLAEAERHLGDFARAKENYLKLLDYDPDGPHGKQARKELNDPVLANAQNAKPSQPAAAEKP
jgi:hypothetical protein